MATIQEFAGKIEQASKEGRIKTKAQLDRLKLNIGRELGVARLPSNPDILASIQSPSNELCQILSIKPLRTLSGVAPVAIMTKPFRCPHGTCIYCPGGPGSFFGNVPQSYTGHEPATMRGINNDYDAYLQTMNRLSQYYATGHNPEKLEFIIMGGTFPATPIEYQEEFISNAFQAANDFSEMFLKDGVFAQEKFNEFFSKEKEFSMKRKETLIAMEKKPDVAAQHFCNETAGARVVTMCIETKPDWSKQEHIDNMLRLGTTRVELGVQTLSDEILKLTNRGHTTWDTKEATRLLKDSGLKVTYHIMPGQPLSSKEKDIGMFRELFENQDYMPDGLKIYPCMPMPGTALGKMHELGKFTPLGTEEAAEIIAEGKRYIEPYARVHRVQRDIPTKFALAGIDKNNLRQIIEAKCAEKGIKCRCIRCRESGINSEKGIDADYSKTETVERRYKANGGEEVFISFEDTKNDLIIGFCRLRRPHKPFRPEFSENACCVRELHVFGSQVGLGRKNDESQQHRGYGKKLIARAEQIAKTEFGAGKLLVISGVGAREYYREKLGYARDGIYMAKKL